MRAKLATASVISLLFLLVCSQSVSVVMGGKWYYWMEPGAYAKYVYFLREGKPSPLVEWIYFTNKSVVTFTNLTFAWRVIDVRDVYATVDYNWTFYGAKPYGDIGTGGTLTFNMTLTVQLDTLELIEDGKPWGRWPYWVHGWEVEVEKNITWPYWLHTQKNITMIHNYISPNPRVGDKPVNVTVSLIECQQEFEIDTPVYKFSEERLLLTSTHPVSANLTNGVLSTPFATEFDVYYDAVSLIFLGEYYGQITDDIMYHNFDIWDVEYSIYGAIRLVDSNINFEPSETPDETPTVSPLLVGGIIAIVVLPILGIALRLRRRRR